MEYQYGNVSSPFRQYDIPYAYPKFYTIPEVAPGRIMADDFIYLSYPGIKDPSRYSVIVESMSVAGTRWRNIGTLSERVHLPFVMFAPTAKLGIIPDTDTLPLYEATLVRGATYLLPDVGGRNGRFHAKRFGGKF